MNLIEITTTYYLPIVLVLCLCVGYLLKNFAPNDNKWIPAILFAVGAVAGCIVLGVSLEAVVKGGFTGLASTGLHQAFRQVIEHPRAGAEGGSNYAAEHEKNDPADVERLQTGKGDK